MPGTIEIAGNSKNTDTGPLLMWLVRFLHVIPPYNVIRAPVDIYKTVIGTWRLE